MSEYTNLDKKSLQLQLESFKLILEANAYLVENNEQLSEQTNYSLGMLENTIDEMGKEAGNDQVQYKPSIDQVPKVLEEIKLLIKRLLN